jgi:hypothetical protein
VTADDLKEGLAAMTIRQSKQILAGESTPAQAQSEREDLLLKGRLELADEDLSEGLRWILSEHQVLADQLAAGAVLFAGNDPERPN